MTKESYQHVNDMWNGVIPPRLDPVTARRAARALWRETMGEPLPWPVRHTNRGRYTWTRMIDCGRIMKKHLVIVPKSGWKSFVHDLSHLAHRRKGKNKLRGHHWSHASWERAMIAIVLRDWMN